MSRRVVVTGIGVVAPNGIGRDTFWRSLLAGRSAVDYISAFDPSPFPSKIAAEIRDFSPADFMRRPAIKTMGRFSQLAIAATRLALEDAALGAHQRFDSNVAVCYGTSGGLDVFEGAARHLLQGGLSAVRPRAALEFPPHTPASYITAEFGIRGPSYSISSNCCTGLDVLNSASSLIRNGVAQVVIAGSTDAPITPVTLAGFCALRSLSTRECHPSEASRPYDRLRDGLVMSEAAATLILEDADAAIHRGARIYAELLGYGARSEGLGLRKGDISGTVMAEAIGAALKASRLVPSQIDHINAHGSSIPDFDICDSNAFLLAFGDRAHSIPIASIKSMVGQPFSAAGVLQAASACLSITTQHIPPTINQQVPDPFCPLDYVPNKSRVARIRHVLVNAHSFGGSVAALVLGRHDSLLR